VDILSTGEIQSHVHGTSAVAYREGFLSFDGIHFVVPSSPAPESPVTTTPQSWLQAPMNLTNGIINYGDSYAPASWARQDNLCLLSGLVDFGSKFDFGKSIATLPKECRPGKIVTGLYSSVSEVYGRLDVTPSGLIRWPVGILNSQSTRNWMGFSGIIFPVAGSGNRKPISLAEEFQDFGHGYEKASYYMQGNELCVVSGMVKLWHNQYWRMGHSVVANLPADCRPRDGQLIFHINQDSHTWRADVTTLGNIQLQFDSTYSNSDRAILPLDNIVFFPSGGTAIQLVNYFPYGNGYRPPQFKRVGRFCILSGLARTSYPRPALIARLPSQCRPEQRLIFGLNHHQFVWRVDVLPNGEVSRVSGTTPHDWISLDGVRFVAV